MPPMFRFANSKYYLAETFYNFCSSFYRIFWLKILIKTQPSKTIISGDSKNVMHVIFDQWICCLLFLKGQFILWQNWANSELIILCHICRCRRISWAQIPVPIVPREVRFARGSGSPRLLGALSQRRGPPKTPELDQRVTLAQQKPRRRFNFIRQRYARTLEYDWQFSVA